MAAANPPDVREILDVVRAWLAINYPGCSLDYVKIHTLFMGREMRLAVLPENPMLAATGGNRPSPGGQ